MNERLIAILRSSLGVRLTPELAADILTAAEQVQPLVPLSEIKRIESEIDGEFIFSIEMIEDITDEIKPLHRAHWDETEAHRHGLPFDPDYETFYRYERAGRYILFTLRKEGQLLGNCAMYLNNSAHTKTLFATEDTLFLLPEARKGRTAMHFVDYVENSLQKLGVSEIDITVKMVNKAARFFMSMGYKQVEIGFNKIIGGKDVQKST